MANKSLDDNLEHEELPSGKSIRFLNKDANLDRGNDEPKNKKGNDEPKNEKGEVRVTDKEVKQELSMVANNPKKNFIIIGVVILVLCVAIYYLVFSDKPEDEEDKINEVKKVTIPTEIVRPTSQYSEKDVPQIPKLPSPPKLENIKVPTAPSIKSEIIDKSINNNKNQGQGQSQSQGQDQGKEQKVQKIDVEKKIESKAEAVNASDKVKKTDIPQLPTGGQSLPLPESVGNIVGGGSVDPQTEAKRRSSIIFYNNEEVLKKKEEQKSAEKSTKKSDDRSANSDNNINNPLIDNKKSKDSNKSQISKTENGSFRYRGDMELLLGRGKLIDAVLESAINTDFSGEIRGIISRDVYSESGRNILIPKGSRIFGHFQTASSNGYGRVAVIWVGIDLINGYSITFDGPAVDNLGRSGVPGRFDSKFKENFTNAILQSAFNIGLAKGLDLLIPPKMTSNQVTSQQVVVSGIQSIVNEILLDKAMSDAAKTTQICARVLQSITDKTTNAFTLIQNACNSPVGANDTERLKNIIDTVKNAGNSLMSNANAIEETQVQKASKEAFENISGMIKDAVEQTKFSPTVTINQGTEIKIYINKDYLFPEEVIYKK